jgi:hypothetical protein
MRSGDERKQKNVMMKPLTRTTTGCVLTLLTALGCWGKTADRTQVGGETNWLVSCTTDADCAVGSCLCNVCTVECRGGDGCGNGPPDSRCMTLGDLGNDCAAGLTSSVPSAGICLAASGSGTKDGSVPAPVSLDATLGEIAQDLAQVSEADRPFMRYLSMQNLANTDPHPGWNEDISPAEIIATRTARGALAVAKLTNSMSTQPTIANPVAVGGRGLLVRIDLRDFGWDHGNDLDDVGYDNGWDAIVAHAQLAVEFQGATANRIKAQTGARVPLLFADDFVAAASTGSVYYELLGIPDTLRVLEQVLRPDPSSTAVAVVRSSGISRAPRAVQRQSFGDAQLPYWVAFDYDASIDEEALLADPTGILAGGMEVIYRLPNGLQAYVLADGIGARTDTSPLSTQVIEDPSQPDGILRNSASCYGCHNAGIVSFSDQRHPKDPTFQLAADADSSVYRSALESIGMVSDTPDPIGPTFVDFGRDVLPGRAAAELFVTPDVLSRQATRLPYPISTFRADAGSAPRSSFVSRYLQALCVLQSGSENQPVGCP